MTKHSCPQCGGQLGGPWGNRCYQCNRAGSPKTGENRKCPVCGRSFYVGGSQLKRYPGGGTYCSRDCTKIGISGQKFRLRKKETRRYITPGGYVLVKVGIHEWILEHRLKMQKKLGRKLERHEVVHHINGVRSDNRLRNLRLCASQSEHHRIHEKEKSGPYMRRKV